MDVLFLKIHIHAHAFQLPHRFQQGDGVSGEPGNGFGDHHIHRPGAAIRQEPLEVFAVVFGAGQSFIGIYARIFPAAVALVGIIADLCRQRMEHGVLSAGHSGVRCDPLQFGDTGLWKAGLGYNSLHVLFLLCINLGYHIFALTGRYIKRFPRKCCQMVSRISCSIWYISDHTQPP